MHTALIDEELAGVMRELLALPGGSRVFRFEADGELRNLTGDGLNEYIRTFMVGCRRQAHDRGNCA